MPFTRLRASDGTKRLVTPYAIHQFKGVGWNSKPQCLIISVMQFTRLQLWDGGLKDQLRIALPRQFTSLWVSDGTLNLSF